MRTVLGLLLIVLLSLPTVAAQAGGRRTRVGWGVGVTAGSGGSGTSVVVRGRTGDGSAADANAAAASARYPKYYGAFHSRQLQNVGVPNGDIGLRGNGFSMFPW